MPTFSLRLALLLVAAVSLPTWGADVLNVKVTQGKNDLYTVNFDATINVPVDQTLKMMLTPGLWPQLSPIIIDAKVLSKDELGPRRVRVIFHDCIFIFCKTIHKTEDITIGLDGHIQSLAIPDQSDFSYAFEDWHIFAEQGHTRIQYHSEMVPNFFLPPLIGPYILKSRMRSQLIHTAINLEKIAERKAKPLSVHNQATPKPPSP